MTIDYKAEAEKMRELKSMLRDCLKFSREYVLAMPEYMDRVDKNLISSIDEINKAISHCERK